MKIFPLRIGGLELEAFKLVEKKRLGIKDSKKEADYYHLKEKLAQISPERLLGPVDLKVHLFSEKFFGRNLFYPTDSDRENLQTAFYYLKHDFDHQYPIHGIYRVYRNDSYGLEKYYINFVTYYFESEYGKEHLGNCYLMNFMLRK